VYSRHHLGWKDSRGLRFALFLKGESGKVGGVEVIIVDPRGSGGEDEKESGEEGKRC